MKMYSHGFSQYQQALNHGFKQPKATLPQKVQSHKKNSRSFEGTTSPVLRKSNQACPLRKVNRRFKGSTQKSRARRKGQGFNVNVTQGDYAVVMEISLLPS